MGKWTEFGGGAVSKALRQSPATPRVHVSRLQANRHDEAVTAIGRALDGRGYAALTDGERIIWNTVLAVSFLTGHRKTMFGPDARVRHWSAARGGMLKMGLPDAADFLVDLVGELARRSEIEPGDHRADASSLRRLATLRQRFGTIEERHDLPARLDEMIDGLYPWADD